MKRKIKIIKEHIRLREEALRKNFTRLQYAYGFFRCMLHRQSEIEDANQGLRICLKHRDWLDEVDSILDKKHS